jgi:hypothetical protein
MRFERDVGNHGAMDREPMDNGSYMDIEPFDGMHMDDIEAFDDPPDEYWMDGLQGFRLVEALKDPAEDTASESFMTL